MRRLLPVLALFVLSIGLATPATVSACPMCKAAAEQDEKQPKAYMYSILFMLGMPTIIFSTLGYGLYRINKREESMEALPPIHYAPSLQKSSVSK